VAESSKICTSLRCTRLSGGAPDSVRCTGRFSSKDTALGNRRWATWLQITELSGEPSAPTLSTRRRTCRSREFTEGAAAKIHWTVRCAPDFPVSQRRPRPTVGSAINEGHVAEPTVTWSHRTVRCAPDSVRCAKGTEGPTVGFTRKGRRLGTGQALFMSVGAPDYPVCHPTEGKNCLPNGTPTAPSCLGAIKGTPMCMDVTSQNFKPRVGTLI
jgi:hypothetical protein